MVAMVTLSLGNGLLLRNVGIVEGVARRVRGGAGLRGGGRAVHHLVVQLSLDQLQRREREQGSSVCACMLCVGGHIPVEVLPSAA